MLAGNKLSIYIRRIFEILFVIYESKLYTISKLLCEEDGFSQVPVCVVQQNLKKENINEIYFI